MEESNSKVFEYKTLRFDGYEIEIEIDYEVHTCRDCGSKLIRYDDMIDVIKTALHRYRALKKDLLEHIAKRAEELEEKKIRLQVAKSFDPRGECWKKPMVLVDFSSVPKNMSNYQDIFDACGRQGYEFSGTMGEFAVFTLRQ